MSTTSFDAAFWSAIAAIASAVAAFLAVVVSAGAAAVAIWQFKITRDHNRLSVRPELAIRFVGPNAANHPVGIFVLNVGLGPARITSVVYKNRATQQITTDRYGFYHLIGPLLKAYKLDDHAQVDIIREGRLIPANSTVQLLWFHPDPVDRDQLREFYSRLDIGLEYESLYGEVRPAAWAQVQGE